MKRIEDMLLRLWVYVAAVAISVMLLLSIVRFGIETWHDVSSTLDGDYWMRCE